MPVDASLQQLLPLLPDEESRLQALELARSPEIQRLHSLIQRLLGPGEARTLEALATHLQTAQPRLLAQLCLPGATASALDRLVPLLGQGVQLRLLAGPEPRPALPGLPTLGCTIRLLSELAEDAFRTLPVPLRKSFAQVAPYSREPGMACPVCDSREIGHTAWTDVGGDKWEDWGCLQCHWYDEENQGISWAKVYALAREEDEAQAARRSQPPPLARAEPSAAEDQTQAQPSAPEDPNSQGLTPQEQASDPRTAASRLWQLAHLGPELRLLAASNPSAPSDLLWWLSQLQDEPQIQEAAAAHPSLPAARLWQLAEENGARVAGSPRFLRIARETPLALKQLSASAQRQLLSSPAFPPELLSSLASVLPDAVEAVRSTPTGLPPPGSGHVASRHRAQIAAAPRTSPEVLLHLAQDSSLLVQIALAGNPRAPAAALLGLASSAHPELQQALIRNPSTPLAALEQVAWHPETGWEQLILLAQTHPAAFGCAPRFPQLVPRSGCREEDLEPLRAAALSADSSAELLRLLSRFPSLHREVAANPRTPAEILNSLHGVYEQLAANPSTPPERLRKLSEPPDRWYPIGGDGNPVILESDWEALETWHRVVRLLLQNPNTPADVLEKLSAKNS